MLSRQQNTTVDINNLKTMNMQYCKANKVAYLHIQQLRSNIIFHLETCFSPPEESKSNIIHSLLALFFGVCQLLRETCGFYSG